jgi:hypothetical protein
MQHSLSTLRCCICSVSNPPSRHRASNEKNGVYGCRSMLTKTNLQAPDCNQGCAPLLFESQRPLHKHGLQNDYFRKFKTSLNIPSSSTSVAASDSTAVDAWRCLLFGRSCCCRAFIIEKCIRIGSTTQSIPCLLLKLDS